MWNLDTPNIEAREAFKACISRAIASDKLAILTPYEEPVVEAADRFETACRAKNLHRLNVADFRPPASRMAAGDAKELKKMYNDRMAPKTAGGHAIYSRIFNLATKCPLCGVGTVRQLDHHLPKGFYPYLAVVPSNLVPVCSDCNHGKNDTVPRSHSEQTLHPYFDDIDQDRWLRAEFTEEIIEAGTEPTEGAGWTWQVRFYVEPPQHWDGRLAARVRHHFTAYGLDDLYRKQVADELTGIGYQLDLVLNSAGPSAVQQQLQDTAHSRARPRHNTWMVALYEALASNPWYYSGGFRIVAEG
ncbi:hypothetical protein [Streptomyces mirabilis]|uniref:hypothetical protein n=1 Tax=Streptomyces mirabilis TaxID=68239 RepID=UPI0036BDA8B5